MMRDYFEVRDWLESFIPLVYGKEELGLARIENLLAKLGNPEKKFKSIHVAGTAGKGSTAFYMARLLEQSSARLSGYQEFRQPGRKPDSPITRQPDNSLKVGLHVSPHLTYIGERMQINGKAISPIRLIRLMSHIRPIIERIQRENPDLVPSYFEILVAASFLYFAEEKVDWAVVEVGLGGRLDATNVLKPELSIITNIGLDHTEILGETIEKIAFEKAGIIKSRVPIITGVLRLRSGSSTGGKALEVIEKIAREKHSPLITINTQDLKKLDKNDVLCSVAKSNDLFNRKPIENLMLAAAALEILKIPLNYPNIEKVSRENFAGRFEEIAGGVILDGAHNPDKIRALLEFIGKFKVQSSKFKVVLVVGFKKGKNWKKMVDLLVKNLPIEKIVATKFYAVTDTGRFAAVEPEEITEYVKSKWKVKVESFNNSQEAVIAAINSNVILSNSEGSRDSSSISSPQNDIRRSSVLVTGSLYLVGEVRTMWKVPHFVEASRGESEF